MRPEDFKLNTNYLSIATATSFSTTITFAGGSIPGNNSEQHQTIDIQVPEATNVVTEYMISLDGETWFPGDEYRFDYSSNVGGCVVLQRVTSKLLRAYLFIGNGGPNTESYPAKTFFVKETTLYAPDMN